MKDTPSNKSLQATRDGRSSSAIAEDVISPACLSSGRWLKSFSHDYFTMKIFIQSIALVACWLLFAHVVVGQELAAFHISDAAYSSRPFLFNCPRFTSAGSTNASPNGVEGMMTILAKHFTTTNYPRGVIIIFQDALICQATPSKGERLGDPVGSPVMIFRDFSVPYPAGSRVLVHGHFIPLADLSEKSFNPPAPHYDTYTGDDAIKKMKEMGLEPPEDMDPAWKDKVKK